MTPATDRDRRPPEPGFFDPLERAHRITIATAIALTALAGALVVVGAPAVARFVSAGLALAALAALVGQAIDQVGERLGPGPTGILQSTLGNLPELFVGIFALRQGLTGVVQAALVGSVLGNAVLVLGLAFVAGGARHGTQRFDAEGPRLNASLLLLVVAALLVPTLAKELHTPAAAHASALSNALAVVLLLVYLVSIPYYLRLGSVDVGGDDGGGADAGQGDTGRGESPAGARRGSGPGPAAAVAATAPLSVAADAAPGSEPGGPWPLPLALTLLALGSAGAAVAADWFVGPLEKATASLGLSQTFTGLVVVAIASNAVENAVGVRFALRAKPEYAISTTLNSPLQVALLLTPVLVLISHAVGPAKLTLVFPPLLVAALAISATVVTVVIYDGEYTWVEGVALIALYCILVTAFWWG